MRCSVTCFQIHAHSYIEFDYVVALFMLKVFCKKVTKSGTPPLTVLVLKWENGTFELQLFEQTFSTCLSRINFQAKKNCISRSDITVKI